VSPEIVLCQTVIFAIRRALCFLASAFMTGTQQNCSGTYDALAISTAPRRSTRCDIPTIRSAIVADYLPVFFETEQIAINVRLDCVRPKDAMGDFYRPSSGIVAHPVDDLIGPSAALPRKGVFRRWRGAKPGQRGGDGFADCGLHRRFDQFQVDFHRGLSIEQTTHFIVSRLHPPSRGLPEA
jgi:hypothetical protein